jgi:ribosomal protein S18 acetylase RimI-like enzyme
MSTEVVIRQAGEGDNEFILSLVSRLAECELPPWRTPQEVEAGTRRWMEEALRSPSATACILVAESSGGDLLGFVFVHEQLDFFTREPVGHISDLAVAKHAEGTGAGSLLMDAAERWARANGYGSIDLNVFAGNDRARRMYDRLGYGVETVRYVKVLGGVSRGAAL